MRNVEDYMDQAKQLVRDLGFGEGYVGFSSERRGRIVITNHSGGDISPELLEELLDLASSYGLSVSVE